MGTIVQFAITLQLAGVCLAAQPIGILFDFRTQPDSAIVDLMQSEIRDILAPARLDLSFQLIGPGVTSQSFRKIVIVRFHGSCQNQADPGGIQLNDPALLDYPALGKTDIVSGHILPSVQVYCNEVRAYVPSVSAAPFAQMYGRALGRVVAHELYHALLSTRDHSRTGIARAAQSPRDLTRDKLALDTLSIGRLRDLYGPRRVDPVELPSELPAR